MRQQIRHFDFAGAVQAVLTQFLEWRLSVILVFAIILGGTSQDLYVFKLPLYILSIVFIGSAFLTRKNDFSALRRPPILIGAGLIGLFLLYLIPLPPSIWTQFEGRDVVENSFTLTQSQTPWFPITLEPEKTYLSLFDFLPVIAIALIMTLSASRKEINKAELSLLAAASFSLALGLAQILFGATLFTSYTVINDGVPRGVFTNVNHQATLLAACLPLGFYWAYKYFQTSRRESRGPFVLSSVASMFFVAGLILTQSIAGYFMLFIGVGLVGFILQKKAKFRIGILGIMLIFLVAFIVDMLFFNTYLLQLMQKYSSDLQTSRNQIFETSLKARGDFGIFGIGPGAFETIYKVYENQNELIAVYVNQAHNDFLQIWMEFGLFGLLWLLAGVAWWVRVAFLAFFKPATSTTRAKIYTLCILMPVLHSSVDYPLRTIAISAVLAFFAIRVDRQLGAKA